MPPSTFAAPYRLDLMPNCGEDENWRAIIDLAQMRKCDLYSVTSTCSAAENSRRIVGVDRALRGKRLDTEVLGELATTRALYDDGAKHRLTVDTS